MQPDVAPDFPGEPLDSLTDSWTFNSAVAVSTPPVKRATLQSELITRTQMFTINRSFFHTDDRVLR
ncbi:TPA: hypothetical protein MIY80_27905 [Klebsiella pneumoniae]|nr:hypothetical protein [Klebsiella pneumoniae]